MKTVLEKFYSGSQALADAVSRHRDWTPHSTWITTEEMLYSIAARPQELLTKINQVVSRLSLGHSGQSQKALRWQQFSIFTVASRNISSSVRFSKTGSP